MDSVYAINIERAVLSSILFNPDEFSYLKKSIKPSDLYLRDHQKVFEAMISLDKEEMPLDEEFIRKKISSHKVNESVLIEILASNPITDTSAYIKEIKESSTKRKLLELGTLIKKKVFEDDSKVIESINELKDALFFIEQKHLSIKEKTPIIDDIMDSFLEDMKSAKENKGKVGVSSGLDELDDKLGGIEDGDLIVIAARPSMGKTSLLCSLMNNLMSNDIPVNMQSLEMPSKKIIRRLVSSRSGEDLADLKKGHIQDNSRFKEAVNFFRNKQLLSINDDGANRSEILSRVDRLLTINSTLKDIFIDHGGQIELDGKTREDIEIGMITRGLKKLAKKHNARIYLFFQLNRAVETRDDKRPILSDLKNSGNIEEDADIILFLYRDGYYKKAKEKASYMPEMEDMEIIVGKNRDGSLGTAIVGFKGKCAAVFNKKKNILIN